MPKRVDHEQRRTEIVDAMLRLAARDGFDAVSIRNVAAEAGCTTRPVQYYFADKAALLAAGHARVFELQATNITNALRKLRDPTPRDVVKTIVRTFLPTTRPARDAMILYYTFYATELTEAKMRIPNARRVPNQLATLIANQIRLHHGDHLPEQLHPDYEAALLVAAIPNLTSAVIAGYMRLADTRRILDHAIDRLLPP